MPVFLMPGMALESRSLQMLQALLSLKKGARFHAWVGMGRLRLAGESG